MLAHSGQVEKGRQGAYLGTIFSGPRWLLVLAIILSILFFPKSQTIVGARPGQSYDIMSPAILNFELAAQLLGDIDLPGESPTVVLVDCSLMARSSRPAHSCWIAGARFHDGRNCIRSG